MEEELVEEEENRIKKYVITGLAIFLIILLIVYFTLYSVSDVVISKVESVKIINNKIEAGKYKIIFNEQTFNNLTQAYYRDYGLEFKACLNGIVDGNEYFVTEIVYPVVYNQKFDEVVSSPCPENTIISLHTHPDNHCIASKVDIKTFEKEKQHNKDRLMMIMCNKDLFNVYF